ncbi:hypothetical protein IWGMT90018_42400 [Mycobacterium kiyosense]|nr:hypothetical protein IWGMT90018_42400 [Mycobacterium kiyosense]
MWGILFAPLLHANWGHLIANTVPVLVLGFLMTLAGLSRFVWATAIIWILGGFGTWLIGDMGSSCRPTDHIGASGLIFGWLAFLLVFGIFVRKLWNIVIGLAVLFVYGGVLLGALPVLGGVWRRVLAGAPVRRTGRSGGGVSAVIAGTQSPGTEAVHPCFPLSHEYAAVAGRDIRLRRGRLDGRAGDHRPVAG